MDATPTTLPARSLLDLTTRKVPPFDNVIIYLAGFEGTKFDPPMLIEGVAPSNDPLLSGLVDLSVWSARPRQHVMAGLIVNPDTILDLVMHFR